MIILNVNINQDNLIKQITGPAPGGTARNFWITEQSANKTKSFPDPRPLRIITELNYPPHALYYRAFRKRSRRV